MDANKLATTDLSWTFPLGLTVTRVILRPPTTTYDHLRRPTTTYDQRRPPTTTAAVRRLNSDKPFLNLDICEAGDGDGSSGGGQYRTVLCRGSTGVVACPYALVVR